MSSEQKQVTSPRVRFVTPNANQSSTAKSPKPTKQSKKSESKSSDFVTLKAEAHIDALLEEMEADTDEELDLFGDVAAVDFDSSDEELQELEAEKKKKHGAVYRTFAQIFKAAGNFLFAQSSLPVVSSSKMELALRAARHKAREAGVDEDHFQRQLKDYCRERVNRDERKPGFYNREMEKMRKAERKERKDHLKSSAERRAKPSKLTNSLSTASTSVSEMASTTLSTPRQTENKELSLSLSLSPRVRNADQALLDVPRINMPSSYPSDSEAKSSARSTHRSKASESSAPNTDRSSESAYPEFPALSDEYKDNGKTLFEACRSGDLAQIRYLVDIRKVDPNSVDDSSPAKHSALHYAVLARDLIGLQYLLSQGASPSIQNRYGDTPLFHAALGGKNRAVTYLLKHHNQLPRTHKSNCKRLCDIRSKDGYSLLHAAASRCALPVVVRLIKHYELSPLDSNNKWGRNCLHRAVLNPSEDVMKYLVETESVPVGSKDAKHKIPADLAISESAKSYLQSRSRSAVIAVEL